MCVRVLLLQERHGSSREWGSWLTHSVLCQANRLEKPRLMHTTVPARAHTQHAQPIYQFSRAFGLGPNLGGQTLSGTRAHMGAKHWTT